MGDFKLDPNYVEVDERIAEFRKVHPEGTLQADMVPAQPGFVAVKAFAYRTPDDPRPGTGLAWEPVPGKTPYTKDSELQNAETSAWGRAIVAVGAADTKRGIASANEVRNRATAPITAPEDEQQATAPSSGAPAEKMEMIRIRKLMKTQHQTHPSVVNGSIAQMTLDQLMDLEASVTA